MSHKNENAQFKFETRCLNKNFYMNENVLHILYKVDFKWSREPIIQYTYWY